MRSKTSQWYEVTIAYDRVQEDGTQKRVSEKFVTEAETFTEAEASIIKETSMFGDVSVKGIVPQAYKEIFFSEKEDDENYYKVKVAFITIDEKTSKEKKSKVLYLVQAKTPDTALEYMKKVMNSSMIDYELLSATETKIFDVFER